MTAMASLLLLLTTPLHAALLGPPAIGRTYARTTSPLMCAAKIYARTTSPLMCAAKIDKAFAQIVDVESAARDLRKGLGLELVQSFLKATERGDAAAAMELCTDDFLYKTHRATTDSLVAAEERLHTKVPPPTKVTHELNEERPGLFVRTIVVKPVPFVKVAVRQEFELRGSEGGGMRLCRAEYIKQ